MIVARPASPKKVGNEKLGAMVEGVEGIGPVTRPTARDCSVEASKTVFLEPLVEKTARDDFELSAVLE